MKRGQVTDMCKLKNTSLFKPKTRNTTIKHNIRGSE